MAKKEKKVAMKRYQFYGPKGIEVLNGSHIIVSLKKSGN